LKILRRIVREDHLPLGRQKESTNYYIKFLGEECNNVKNQIPRQSEEEGGLFNLGENCSKGNWSQDYREGKSKQDGGVCAQPGKKEDLAGTGWEKTEK